VDFWAFVDSIGLKKGTLIALGTPRSLAWHMGGPADRTVAHRILLASITQVIVVPTWETTRFYLRISIRYLRTEVRGRKRSGIHTQSDFMRRAVSNGVMRSLLTPSRFDLAPEDLEIGRRTPAALPHPAVAPGRVTFSSAGPRPTCASPAAQSRATSPAGFANRPRPSHFPLIVDQTLSIVVRCHSWWMSSKWRDAGRDGFFRTVECRCDTGGRACLARCTHCAQYYAQPPASLRTPAGPLGLSPAAARKATGLSFDSRCARADVAERSGTPALRIAALPLTCGRILGPGADCRPHSAARSSFTPPTSRSALVIGPEHIPVFGVR